MVVHEIEESNQLTPCTIERANSTINHSSSKRTSRKGSSLHFRQHSSFHQNSSLKKPHHHSRQILATIANTSPIKGVKYSEDKLKNLSSGQLLHEDMVAPEGKATIVPSQPLRPFPEEDHLIQTLLRKQNSAMLALKIKLSEQNSRRMSIKDEEQSKQNQAESSS